MQVLKFFVFFFVAGLGVSVTFCSLAVFDNNNDDERNASCWAHVCERVP